MLRPSMRSRCLPLTPAPACAVPPPSCCSAGPPLRVEGVAQAVTDQVPAEDGDDDGNAREEQPGGELDADAAARRVAQQHAPAGRVRFARSEADVRKARFE